MSTLPPAYGRQASFTGFHTEPAPTVGQDLEAEFNAIKLSQDGTQARLREIQRDDGKLGNLSVHPDSLSQSTRSLLTVRYGGEIRGAWAATTVYNVGDVIEGPDNGTYIAVTQHVANATFGVDLTAGRWITLQLRPGGFVFVDDEGIKGDASDETSSLQNLFSTHAGKVIFMGVGKTYGVSAAGITIPANTTLITNGSKFKKLAASATYGITTSANVDIDSLILETPGGAFVTDAGIHIAGGNARIGLAYAKALTAGAAGGYGVTIGTGVQGSPITGVNVTARSDGFRTGVRLFEVEWSTVSYKSENCEQGIYIRDCKDISVNGAGVESMWGSTDGSAGDNGALIESVTADYSCRNVYLNGVTIRVSGEHGFRLGGSKKLLNIHHNFCGAYLAGSGSASVGGTGFKALGGTITTPHEGIYYNNCFVEDAGSSNSNWSGFIVGLCDGVHITNCTVRGRTLTNSGFYGIWVDSCRNVTIDSCQSRNANTYALYISAAFTGFDTENVNVIGGIYDLPASGFGTPRRCVVVSAVAANIKNVTINGALLRGGEVALTTTVPGGGFGYTGCSARFSHRDPSSTIGNPPVVLNNAADFLINVDGPWYGTFSASGRDGSLFQDLTNGIVRERRAGAWYESGERWGTWTPTFALVTNVDAATANGAWRWFRMGDIVHFSGSVNIDNTAASVASELGISLTGAGTPPPASNFTSFADVAGTGVASTPASLCATVQADTANDRLALKWQAVSTTDNRAWFITGSYQVK